MRQLLINKPEGLGVYPFVSLEEMTKQVLIVKPKEANAGDILLYNKTTTKMKLVKAADSLDSYDASVYSPVGVVMIPSNHNIYGTGEFAVISLDYMNCEHPDTGSTTGDVIYWGGCAPDIWYHYDIPELENYTLKTPGNYHNMISLPSTNKLSQFNIMSDDGVARYYEDIELNEDAELPERCYSPYTADGNREQRYINVMKDFDGKSNTDKIMNNVTASWESGSIANSYDPGNYPPACCCRRYSVLGTEPGDWYLGAIGEMGYMIARFQEIQDSLIKIKTKFSKGGEFDVMDDMFLCSTETDADGTYFIDVRSGSIYDSTPKYNGFYVRALLRVSLSQI